MYNTHQPGLRRRMAYASFLHERRNRPQKIYLKEGVIEKHLFESSKVTQSDGLEFCVICQDHIFLDIIRKLQCRHEFHINCIDNWLTTKEWCPVCKTNLK